MQFGGSEGVVDVPRPPPRRSQSGPCKPGARSRRPQLVACAAVVFAETAVGALDVDVHATNDALATNMSTPVTPTAIRRRDSRRARAVAFISNLWSVKTATAQAIFMGKVERAPRRAGHLCASEHRRCVPAS